MPPTLLIRADEVIEYALFCCNALCLLLAQSGHHDRAEPCPLSGEEWTSRIQSVMSGFDPKRTSVEWRAVAVQQLE
jgi:hypothetical protein